ncbi:hypothetical protein OF387_08370 [Lentilactobacillus hilgardii]|nr:hypothetical protein [Lentilactobacillus hilgardii]MCV3741242.1 hypothetical protein [Lentilactobacillus hilgardii]
MDINNFDQIFKNNQSKLQHWAHQDALNTKLNIPEEDFFSDYELTLWQVWDKYHARLAKQPNSEELFARLIKVALNNTQKDVFKKYRTIKNGQNTYPSAQWCSLNESIGTYINPHGYENPEERLALDLLEDQIKFFKQLYPKDSFIISLLSQGAPYEVISQKVFCETNYDTIVRQRISRIRLKFKNYLNNHGISN